MEVHVLPATSGLDDVLATGADGVFFSNGPGDPAVAERQIGLLREVLERRIPFFGICFGNQLLGRALGFGTYKLGYGHRGINQPVIDRSTGKVEVTAHNHGFAVDAPAGGEPVDSAFGRARVSHVCLNDDVVEGLDCLEVPAFSVQYHPEAAAGPHDASYLFDRFADLMREKAPDAQKN
jgi:carbamoyl-phosphate synthase small subunit